MTISKHNITAFIGGETLPITAASIQIDDSWSPYIQASFEVPYTATIAELVDPRNSNRVTLYTEQVFGNSDPISTWTALYGGFTIAKLTTAYNGKFIYEVSAGHFYPYNNFGARSATMRSFDLSIRSRVINYQTSTISVQLASNEALLQDYALVANETYKPTSLNVRTVVNDTLKLIGAALAPDTGATGTIEDGAQYWEPGQSAWDYLLPIVQASALSLYCDEFQQWHLIDDNFIEDGQTSLNYTNTITQATDTVSRDEFNWYDSVVIKYTWTDNGVTYTKYDTATSGTVTKTLSLTYQDQRYPGIGAAQRVLDRALGRGRVNEITAISDYNTTPRQPVTIDLPDAETQTGFVSAVNFTYPNNVMTVKTRGLINTPSTAWVFQPVGRRWQDISAGVSWASFV